MRDKNTLVRKKFLTVFVLILVLAPFLFIFLKYDTRPKQAAPAPVMSQKVQSVQKEVDALQKEMAQTEINALK